MVPAPKVECSFPTELYPHPSLPPHGGHTVKTRNDVRDTWQPGSCVSPGQNETSMHACSVTQSCPTPGDLWTAACRALQSMGFPRQGCWSRLPFPSPGDLPHPGIKPESPALAGGFFTTGATWEDSLSNVMLILIQKQTHFLPLPAPSPLSPASRGLILLPVT